MIIAKERFWKNVRKEEQNNNLFLIYLDEICLKSDRGNNIKLPARLADEVAREWNADGKIDTIKNSFYTKLCFSVIDMAQKDREVVLTHLVAYGNCDPICYIADEPKKLHIRQKKLYDPLIEWAQKALSIKLNTGAGLLFIEQPSHNCGNIKKFLEELDNFQLTIIHELTKSLGSLFTSLALYNNIISSDHAWEVAHVEDNFRIDIWGKVEEETLIKSVNFDHFNKLVKILKMV